MKNTLKTNENIIIVGVADKNFITPYIICFSSILKHTQSFIELHLIIDQKPEYYFDYINYHLSKFSSNYLLKLHYLPYKYQDICFKHFKKVTTHCTNSTFMKICIPELFKTYTKVLYVDGDFCFYSDIKDLFSIDVSSYLLGAITHKCFLHMFNAGLLLLNIQKLLEFNYLDKYINWHNDHYQQVYGDQICWNGIINKWKELPKEWNVPYVNNYLIFNDYKLSSTEFNNTKAMHFISEKKPWYHSWYRDKKDEFITEYNNLYKLIQINQKNSIKKIHVCYITDDNYILPTEISMYSLLQHTSCFIHFYVISNKCSFTLLEDIKKVFSSFNNCKLHIINIPLEIYNKLEYFNTKSEGNFITNTTWIRLYLDNIFKNIDIDYLFYIDSDTLVLDDLALFPINKYSEISVIHTSLPTFYKKETKQIPVYFNAGVCLINLKKIKSQNISNQCEQYYKINNNLEFNDQDVWNVIFNHTKCIVENKWNLSHFELKLNLEESYLLCGIIHFVGKIKPWSFNKKLRSLNKVNHLLCLLYNNWRREYAKRKESILKDKKYI